MRSLKVAGIIVGALIVTALGIDASDTLQGVRGTLLSNVVSSPLSGGCPGGMQAVENHPSLNCVDIYESSASDDCPIDDPKNVFDSQQNLEAADCASVSKEDEIPWRFVTREQAVQACAKAGKRLLSAAEWYALSVGIQKPGETCNVSSNSVLKTGQKSECTSPAGVHDMVGNVWEWVSDDVFDGMYNERRLPQTGYVAQVDSGGVATVSSSTPSELLGNDYFWSNAEGVYAMMRGGFYGSGSDAGVYTVHADTLPTNAGTAIGFRCGS